MKIDELVLILSTDWFLPYWNEIGIQLSLPKRIAVQQGCREIGFHILGGAEDYFHCDHSSERKRETSFKFRELLQELEVALDFQDTYSKWSSLSHQELAASFSFAFVTLEVVRGHQKDATTTLDGAVLTAIQEAWIEPERNAEAYLDLCWKSMTDWDAHARNVMGSPTALSSTLKSVFRHQRFMAFSARLRSKLTKSQREHLAGWYREMRSARFKPTR